LRSWTDRLGRLPLVALAVLCAGLALHNLAMAELWDAGVRGGALDVVAAWKEALLAAAILAALWARRDDLARAHLRLPDALAAAYVVFVVVYAVVWGVGIHPSIVTASLRAIVNAVNRAIAARGALAAVAAAFEEAG